MLGIKQILKADHTRAIDRYIDYFGGWPAATISPERDPCGERFLDAVLARRGPDSPKQTVRVTRAS